MEESVKQKKNRGEATEQRRAGLKMCKEAAEGVGEKEKGMRDEDKEPAEKKMHKRKSKKSRH